MKPLPTFMRLMRLQYLCFTHGHRAWAKTLGQRLREMRADHPTLRRL